MKSIPVYEAKNKFSALLAAVEKGEAFLVTRHGAPVARIVPAGEGAALGDEELARRRRAMQRLLAFREEHPVADWGADELRAAIEEGRD
ncbi:MAG: type II toxin-antitoxin system prevent-host-death family antitoxin [Rhodocyclaceae bacterium]|nr:type II toxin-antitoxin system prevent-host-death family antitoxin [Rhodocyclaceae bacterium]